MSQLKENKLLWKIEDGIGHLLLNSPPKNIMDIEFFKELSWIIEEKIKISEVNGIIIYGNGRHFSAGAELNDLISYLLSTTKETNKENIITYPNIIFENVNLFNYFKHLPIPVIAAINGVCIGSGLELALSCHVRICSERALLGIPEVTFGLMPGCGGTQRLQHSLSCAKTIELILTGEIISAEEGFQIGLIDYLVPKDQIVSKAISYIKQKISKISI